MHPTTDLFVDLGALGTVVSIPRGYPTWTISVFQDVSIRCTIINCVVLRCGFLFLQDVNDRALEFRPVQHLPKYRCVLRLASVSLVLLPGHSSGFDLSSRVCSGWYGNSLPWPHNVLDCDCVCSNTQVG